MMTEKGETVGLPREQIKKGRPFEGISIHTRSSELEEASSQLSV